VYGLAFLPSLAHPAPDCEGATQQFRFAPMQQDLSTKRFMGHNSRVFQQRLMPAYEIRACKIIIVSILFPMRCQMMLAL
jgi:hypothetical protein